MESRECQKNSGVSSTLQSEQEYEGVVITLSNARIAECPVFS